jgi:hypothetical protein
VGGGPMLPFSGARGAPIIKAETLGINAQAIEA